MRLVMISICCKRVGNGYGRGNKKAAERLQMVMVTVVKHVARTLFTPFSYNVLDILVINS